MTFYDPLCDSVWFPLNDFVILLHGNFIAMFMEMTHVNIMDLLVLSWNSNFEGSVWGHIKNLIEYSKSAKIEVIRVYIFILFPFHCLFRFHSSGAKLLQMLVLRQWKQVWKLPPFKIIKIWLRCQGQSWWVIRLWRWFIICIMLVGFLNSEAPDPS